MHIQILLILIVVYIDDFDYLCLHKLPVGKVILSCTIQVFYYCLAKFPQNLSAKQVYDIKKGEDLHCACILKIEK